jgi:hypothetical protein
VPAGELQKYTKHDIYAFWVMNSRNKTVYTLDSDRRNPEIKGNFFLRMLADALQN